MSACATAEQALKDSQPRILRIALLSALLIHVVAFVATPTLSITPYRLSDEGPPPVRPENIAFEVPEPEEETPKPPQVREFQPTPDAGSDATIGSTTFDHEDLSFPVFEERARRDSFKSFDVAPKVVLQVDPVYPDLARQAELEGSVGLLIVVDEMGNVERADVVQSVPGLDETAKAAVLRWKFEPARQRDIPVRVRVFQVVRFRLRG
ncbi:MAG: energy transducer TonB [Candidatus Eisenbacteria bacterium]